MRKKNAKAANYRPKAGDKEHASKPIWEVFEEIVKEVPPQDLRKLPADGAEHHDHYLYARTKRTP